LINGRRKENQSLMKSVGKSRWEVSDIAGGKERGYVSKFNVLYLIAGRIPI
jgi:hypothetical protein